MMTIMSTWLAPEYNIVYIDFIKQIKTKKRRENDGKTKIKPWKDARDERDKYMQEFNSWHNPTVSLLLINNSN